MRYTSRQITIAQSMDTPLRVLLVAASAADAEPLLEELRKAGHEVFGEIVRTAAEMERALHDKTWNVVVSNDQVPEFSALAALARAVRASEARKSAMVEAALDAIVTIDAEGRIIEFNA